MRDPEHRSRARHCQNLEPNAAISRLQWAAPSRFFLLCGAFAELLLGLVAAANCDSVGQWGVY